MYVVHSYVSVESLWLWDQLQVSVHDVQVRTYIFIRIDCLFNRTDNIFLLHWLYFFICENNLSINLYRSYIHILYGRSWSSAQTKIWSHINCTDNSTLSLHIICNIVCGRFPVNLHRHSKNNCTIFYITSVKSIAPLLENLFLNFKWKVHSEFQVFAPVVFSHHQ